MADPDAENRKRKVCIPVGVRGKADPSNIGAHALTRVSSSYKVAIPGVMALPVTVKQIDTRVPWAPDDPNKERLPKPKKPKKKKTEQK